MPDQTCSECRYWIEEEDEREGFGRCHVERYSAGGPLHPEATRVGCVDWKQGT